METMINLIDLLKHEILDLYSAEEQIIEALPAMIEKAKSPDLKAALREHLKITEDQKTRLDKVKTFFGEGDGEGGEEKKGFFSKLFSGGEKCKGMEGLITEGNKMMGADISEEALDAAIIANAQKIEHYEISGYGTARAFARQLNLGEVERLLTETLNEEYTADDNLTDLAVGKLNNEADQATSLETSGRRARNKAASNKSGSKSSKSGSKNSSGSASKTSSKSSSKGNSKSSSKTSSKSSSKGNSKSSKTSSKSSSKGNSKSISKGSSKSSKGSSKSSSKPNSKGRSKNSSKSSSRNSNKSAGNKSSAKGSKSSSRGRK